MLGKLIQKIKPLVTRNHLWVERSHQVLLERWTGRLQFDLDYVLAHFLLRKRPLNMIQIGACDGVLDDPVEPYIRAGLIRGLLVEPQPEAFHALRERYGNTPGIQLENSAIDDSPGVLKLHRIKSSHRHLLPSYAFGMATVVPKSLLEALNRVTDEPWDAIEIIDVPALTWQQLIEKHPLQTIDFLLVDTEGLDGKLLMSFPFDQYQPPLIHFEWNHLAASEMSALLNRLMDMGYHLELAGINAIAYQTTAVCQQRLLDSFPSSNSPEN